MKLVALFSVWIYLVRQIHPLVLPLTTFEFFRATTQRCLESTQASVVDPVECSLGNLPEDENFQCFSTCVLYEHGLLDDEGHLKQFDFGYWIPGLTSAMDACSGKNGTDYCNVGFKTAKCLLGKLDIFGEICSMANNEYIYVAKLA